MSKESKPKLSIVQYQHNILLNFMSQIFMVWYEKCKMILMPCQPSHFIYEIL